jgi:hypothetical protein
MVTGPRTGIVNEPTRTVEELVTDVTAALAGESAKPADRVTALMVVKAYALRFMICLPAMPPVSLTPLSSRLPHSTGCV